MKILSSLFSFAFKIAHFANSSQIFFRIRFLNLCSPRVTHPKSDSDSFAGFYEMCTTKQVLNSQTFFVLAGLAKPKISVRDKTNHDTGYQAVFVNPSYLLQLNGTFHLSALFFATYCSHWHKKNLKGEDIVKFCNLWSIRFNFICIK